MTKEKEKGIEELYNYLVKNKDKMSKEEYNDLKKDFKNSLFKLHREESISDEFFGEYYEKIRELEGEGTIRKKPKRELKEEITIKEKKTIPHREEKYCKNCKQMVTPTSGAHPIVFLLLILFFLIPGIIYLFWAESGRGKCPMCGGKNWGSKSMIKKRESDKFCNRCGSANDKDAAFCVGCGKRL